MQQLNADLAPAESLISELEDYRRQIEAIKRDAEDLLRGLSEEQFNWRQDAGRWSIAECLTHLNVTGNLYIPVIEKGIEHGRSRRLLGSGPFKYGWFGNAFVRSAEPPVKIYVKAPKAFVPPPDQPMSSVVPEFFQIQERLLACVRAANGVDLARVKIQSPAWRWVRLSLGRGLALMPAHERRHLWQARYVKDDPNFPAL
jgi:hypothetical protein